MIHLALCTVGQGTEAGLGCPETSHRSEKTQSRNNDASTGQTDKREHVFWVCFPTSVQVKWEILNIFKVKRVQIHVLTEDLLRYLGITQVRAQVRWKDVFSSALELFTWIQAVNAGITSCDSNEETCMDAVRNLIVSLAGVRPERMWRDTAVYQTLSPFLWLPFIVVWDQSQFPAIRLGLDGG